MEAGQPPAGLDTAEVETSSGLSSNLASLPVGSLSSRTGTGMTTSEVDWKHEYDHDLSVFDWPAVFQSFGACTGLIRPRNMVNVRKERLL
jgi:hypothetical protein